MKHMKYGLVVNVCSMLVLFLLCFGFNNAHAAHPLITDDTGTAGKGKFEIEIGAEYGHDDSDGVTESTTEVVPVFVYGITDAIDITPQFASTIRTD
jgi:hypothetical protein